MTPSPTPPQPCDLLIEAGWIIPVEPHGRVLERHAVAVQDGRILALLPIADARTRYAPRERVDLPHSVVLPGFVNVHTHNPMTLMRGVADDLDLMTWLRGHIWPAEAAVMSAGFCADGAEFAVAEMLRGGTTCCNENYFFPDVAAATYRRLGFRALVGLPAIEFPSAWARTRDETIDEGWWGPRVTDAARSRLGDVALVAREAVSYIDEADTGPYELLGRHGSLTAAEMLVPLLVGVNR